MHVLVTGGTGFIGQELVVALVANGHRVSVLSRKAGKMPFREGIHYTGRLDGLRAVDAVINLAGENLAERRWTATRKQQLRDSRIGTTQRLLSWMESLPTPPRTLISGSAIGYYGPRDDSPLDESATPGEDFAARLCRDWEAEALRAQALGLRVCTLRTGVVLGRDGGALAKMLPAFKLGGGGPMGDGQQWMSWVRRVDLVRLLIWLLENPACQGAYNGTAPEPVRNRDFARALAASLRRPALLPMPAPALRLLLGEMAGLLLSGQRVLPVRAQAEGFVFRHPSLAAALPEIVR